MAQNDIERRETRYWPWMLALVVLALLSWWMFGRGRNDITSAGPVDSTLSPAMAATTPEVTEFLRFADDRSGQNAMGLDHTYTANGIRRLAAALGSLAPAGGNPDIATAVQMLSGRASRLERDSSSSQHADEARQMFLSLAGLLTSVQKLRAPDMSAEASSVGDAANAVRADQPLLDQKEQVRAFFDRAATALRRITAAG